jgi:diadenosine tetraphosphatase ApaH/serine/threonine PP2A family protein phosphatase
MNSEQIVVIGDIHGCAKTLKALLKKIPKNCQLYCVGDLIDRGPRNKEVVAICQNKDIKCTTGNHEWLCINGYNSDQPYYANWLPNGGKQTLAEFNNEKKLNDLVRYIKSFPYYYDLGEYLICHAGVKKGLSLKQSAKMAESQVENIFLTSIVWNRSAIFLKNKFIISGHTPVLEPILTKDYCNIDTSCVYKKKLTAIILPEKKFIQVDYCD